MAEMARRLVGIWFAVLAMIAVLAGCSDTPHGRWQVIAPIEVYASIDDFAPTFYLQPGEICALGDEWSYQKAFRFKRVSCERGVGWVMTDSEFERVWGSS
ncbi:hypothetical protein [Achromobacter sp.]|uniref:hypothetical protein n=1 Tax=Achromobacter sp. TaxID=134375 RepID=UPI0028AF9173|nr:hypothetical protein [Achromobacter sp.]